MIGAFSLSEFFVAALAMCAFVALAVAVVIFNGLVRLGNACDRAWSNIDVLLKQRYDEIPNLVAVCRGLMEHERDALERVTESRSAGLAALARGRGEHGVHRAAARASEAIARLFTVAESYPAIKSSEQFLTLQKRITALENEIADRREHFNQCVTNYNVRIEQVPDRFLARVLGCKRRAHWRVLASETMAPGVHALADAVFARLASRRATPERAR